MVYHHVAYTLVHMLILRRCGKNYKRNQALVPPGKLHCFLLHSNDIPDNRWSIPHTQNIRDPLLAF